MHATVLGAIIGADVANKRADSQQLLDTSQEQRCNKVRFYEHKSLKTILLHYEWRGIQGSTVTYNNYRVGDRLSVTVSIQAD